ncbi:MAG: glycosyltransferase [Cyclobacteriaceae bacterium]|nr:glycosyltransferase [Cyclobacteriaceae bacterium]MDX5466383.1 glycosyltransferase [Cyclobacteriaceae bacterium]
MNFGELATIICIAYNQEEWIEETLGSVREQDYNFRELFVVDNGSTDNTAQKIKDWVNQNSTQLSVHTILLKESKPYCSLFNEILAEAKGRYIIDLSGDDVLFPDHISQSIRALQQAHHAAFSFSDAYILDARNEITTFYKRNTAGELEDEIELSNLYEILIRKNYICSPTVVFQAEILKKEGGYDESLYYEDFDVQLRLARKYPVIFSDHIGVLKRKHGNSMSSAQYKRYHSPMLPSTVKVCSKIETMNIYPEESRALAKRVMHELKHALWSANFGPAKELVDMGKRIGLKGLLFKFYALWASKEWDISWAYELMI